MLAIEIIYEDSDVLVVNKPAGLVVHPDGKTDEPTLTDWILEQYPQTAHVGEPFIKEDGTEILRPGIVHRLDRETSGVLVIAKNQPAFEHLKKQFQNRDVTKIYNAFVYGEMKDTEGVIDQAIGKSKKDFRLRIAVDQRLPAGRQARGTLRGAVTEYTVLEKWKDDEKVPRTFSFLEVRPQTGRTHQIRVHLKAINHPVVCDKLYAPKKECTLGFRRLALHARSLSFQLPDGTSITAEAPLPEDFDAARRVLSSGV